MKKRSKIYEYIYTLVFTVVMTAICILGVSFAYQQSKARIQLNSELFTKRAVLSAANIPAEGSPEEIAKVYDENITVSKHGDKEWYRTKTGDYVIPVTGTGLWGKIDAVIGFDKTFKTLTGISFTDNNETPGLGARITEKWFREQFRNKKAPLSFVAEGTKSDKDNEFDAITGATITTSAVKDMVNKTAKEAPGMVWGGK